jgi:hypothetical protein
MREHGRGGSGTTLAGLHHVGAIPTGSARLGFGQQFVLPHWDECSCMQSRKELS